MLLAGSALAAPANNSQQVSVASGTADLGGFTLQAPVPLDPLPIVLTDLTISATANWTGNITTDVGWDSDKVRQGADLAVTRTASATSGSLDVKWQFSGKIDGVGFGPDTISTNNVTCNPQLSGAVFECSANSPSIGIPGAFVPDLVGFLVAKIGIGLKFDVTPQGAVVSRTLSIGGNNLVGPNDLSLTDSPQTETVPVPCTTGAGEGVAYSLDPYHWSPATTATQQVQIAIVQAFDPDGVSQVGPDIHDFPVGSANVTNPAFDLTGPGFTTNLGPVLPNDIKPTIAPLGQFSGQEGSPISFSASASSPCAIASYVWNFSDGTTSYGPTPQRTFHDGGVYSGQLTVTDNTGLSTTQDFSVSVANLAPSVNAGPDTTSDWGVQVQFNGQATAAGSDDQATLQYSWAFGDGSPSADGGPSVAHTYKLPGVYTATLTVCDEDGLCNHATRVIHVTKRDTTLGYTGPLSSSPDKVVTLTANLVDEFGQPVAGEKVNFVLGTQTVNATTDASGQASVSIKLAQKPGSYPLTVTFPGDPRYNGSSASGTFVVGK
jgi:PKD repeat protein